MQIILLEHFPIGTESLESLYNQSSSLQQYTLVCVCVCVCVCVWLPRWHSGKEYACQCRSR